MLVEMQRPGARYVLTKKEWEKRYNRVLKENARPLVILFPFGPVEFVFDIADTMQNEENRLPIGLSNNEILDEIARPFKTKNNVSDDILNTLIDNLAVNGIALDTNMIAGAGYKVAKHGNYAATSTSGASNVIAHHGIRFSDDIDQLNRSINECGIVYLHAQLFAKAMKFVGPIRKALQFPTCFNLLGPIVNPSQPQCQLLGVANLDQMRLYSNVYQKMGIDYGIVNSIDGYDEISLTGDFKVTTNSYERIFKPQDLGFEIAKPEELVAGANEDEAAAIFDSVLENRCLPAQKNIVLANAAFGIQVLEKGQKSIEECIAIARESIDSGRALNTFKKFVELNS